MANNQMKIDEDMLNESISKIQNSINIISEKATALAGLVSSLVEQTGGNYPVLVQSATILNKEQVSINKVTEALEETIKQARQYIEGIQDAGTSMGLAEFAD